MILLSLMILAAGVGAFVFGETVDSRTRAQKAADAASLAAARDVRDLLIPAFSRGHIAPTPVSPPILTDWQIQSGFVNAMGVRGANDFAGRNDSTVTKYSPRALEITVDTLSNDREVKSPVGDAVRESLNSPATATAYIDASKIRCTSRVIRDPRTRAVISWSVTCTGNGSSATANYIGSSTVPTNVAGNLDAWRKLFVIRLVD